MANIIQYINKCLLLSLTTSVNSAYLNKCQFWSDNSWFILLLVVNLEIVNVPLTGDNWSQSLIIRPVNNKSILVKNILVNLIFISVQRSLETIDISLIVRSFTSDNWFLKDTFNLSLKWSNFTSGLIDRAEWIIVPPIFTGGVPVGPSKRTVGFLVLCNWRARFLKHYILFFYQCIHFLKGIYNEHNIYTIVFSIFFSPIMTSIEKFMLLWI